MERRDFDCIVKVQKAWRLYNHKRKMLEQRAEAASMLKGRKERRRESVEIKWDGDYINYEENTELQTVMDTYSFVLFIYLAFILFYFIINFSFIFIQ